MTTLENALRLLDDVLGPRTVSELEMDQSKREEAYLASLGMFAPDMGGIETQGCGVCGGTMYRTYEVDKDGNRTSESQFICSNPNCGKMK